ncbi:MAG: glycoside hydrolase family 43 protein [Roseburia sp.]|nr:glycoside hydrolase family 43 protein [Roseburia sp.]
MIKSIFTAILIAVSFMPLEAQNITEITPGKVWADNNGKHINAHGGGIIEYDGTYYWYGENRPEHGFTTEVGVEVFSSKDLMNWKDEGVALAVTEKEGDDIERGCIMERPKVVYCKKTGKFVMLFHLELKGKGYAAARVGFAESDSPTGPFRFVRSLRPNAGIWPKDFSKKQIKAAKEQRQEDYKDWWTPEWRVAIEKGMFLNRDMEGGQMSRDMTVYIDTDGKAYHIFSSEDNLTLQVAELTDDFMDYTGKYVRIAPGGQNEAPTIFKRDGKYWLIASGCTGWAPNEARMFSAKSIWGPWTQHPSPFEGEAAPHKDGGANKSFGTQGTYVLNLGNDRLVFMADIWNPKSLANSLHVWLPIDFKADGTPVIRWKDSWKLD